MLENGSLIFSIDFVVVEFKRLLATGPIEIEKKLKHFNFRCKQSAQVIDVRNDCGRPDVECSRLVTDDFCRLLSSIRSNG